MSNRSEHKRIEDKLDSVRIGSASIIDKLNALYEYLGLEYTTMQPPLPRVEKICKKCKHIPSVSTYPLYTPTPSCTGAYFNMGLCTCPCHKKGKKDE